MGKVLKLGAKLKYPIVITKLLKQPGDQIKKQDAILQYKFTWQMQLGDVFKGGDEYTMEDITTTADWESPVEGEITQWKVHEGMSVAGDMDFVDVKEDCSHAIQFAGLCGICGKDMTETSWASTSVDTERAQISMIHDQTHLTVSQNEASRAEEELQRRLLKHRKLTLVVDLDQTIIHACIEPTVGEWQRDPTSPNYEAVKDVVAFQLNDDAPRGLASKFWYYIKMRPGLREFLSKIAELYELHVYTMGTRAYALNIAKIVDPDKRLFGDRIISRDENGSMTAKSLARLFPVDTKMVVIIDDRADVWPKNRPNLIKVHPYDFFLGIGDINSSFLPKREEIPKADPPVKKAALVQAADNPTTTDSPESTPASVEANGREAITETNEKDGSSRVSALEELVKMGGGDDHALLEERSAEQEKFLEKQITERPLAHLQEQLEKEASDEEKVEAESETQNGTPEKPHPHHRHNLLKDDDVELMYLEQHLSRLHKAFYDQYDSALVNAHGGRVAQLKPGRNKKILIKGDAADLKIVPDIGHVMPALKSKVLEGTVLVMSGLVPLSADVMRTEIAIQAQSFGAALQRDVSRKVTHVITPSSRTRTSKVRHAARYPNIKIVTHQWLLDTISKWEKQDEAPYLVNAPYSSVLCFFLTQQVEIHESDRKSAPSSLRESDDSAEDEDSTADEDEGGEDPSSIPASQEEENVEPDDFEGGVSPIDGNMNWAAMEDELAEFMGGDDTDEGNESDASTSTTYSTRSARGTKRPYGDIVDDDDGEDDEELNSPNASAKKQRTSNDRSTGLKATDTAGEETSLPTPGKTDADDLDEDDEDDGGFADLEADLEAELEADG